MMVSDSTTLDSSHKQSIHGDEEDLRGGSHGDCTGTSTGQSTSSSSSSAPSPPSLQDLVERDGNDGGANSVSSHDHHSDSAESVTSSTMTGHNSKKSDTSSGADTRAVHHLRAFMILTLLCCTITISVMVWYYTAESEKQEFEKGFQAQGFKLLTGFRDDSHQKMQALDALSKTLTNHAKGANMTWPFVTIENSHEFLTPYLSLANAASIKVLPLVKARQRMAWELYARENQEWVGEDLYHRLESGGAGRHEGHSGARELLRYADDSAVSPYIKNYVGVDTSPTQWMPNWQYTPVIQNKWFINFNQLADAQFYREVVSSVLIMGKAVISKTEYFEPGLDFQSTKDFDFIEELLAAGGNGRYQPGEPIAYIHYPVRESLEHWDENKNSTSQNPVVAIVSATVYWRTFLQNILPEDTNGITVVIKNNEQAFSYIVNGPEAVYQGMGDLHDPKYDSYLIEAEYSAFQNGTESATYSGVAVDNDAILGSYRIVVYPSIVVQETYVTNDPWIYASVVAMLMIMVVAVFVLYDWYVERRQRKVSSEAIKSNAIITSLFPAKVRDQLLNMHDTAAQLSNKITRTPGMPTSQGMRRFQLNKDNGQDEDFSPMIDHDDDELDPHRGSLPIADFFPSCTVLFMDIAGFTAWSSTREPSHVFQLLETIYRAFDTLAKKRKVFKVETIGDCYVAVCGLPEPCEAHALKMARFTGECIEKMNSLVHRLEPKLGPDTGDLTVRAGLHSGPVTAGVLRGDRARFQLFGDTVNTAARMESTGEKGRIQVSQQFAELISAHGKGVWLKKRSNGIQVKGKGTMETFWLLPYSKATPSKNDSSVSHDPEEMSPFVQDVSPSQMVIDSPQTQRLIEYNLQLMLDTLQKIQVTRIGRNRDRLRSKQVVDAIHRFEQQKLETKACVQEVVEIIELPPSGKSKSMSSSPGHEGNLLSPSVVRQLREYCQQIAQSYLLNPFHNFKHASHVVQSTAKLMSRIVATNEASTLVMNSGGCHDNTFGIASDPLTQFAVIFSALIHDVNHKGVPNPILAQEEPEVASTYHNQAIAEQFSVSVAWTLLMRPDFADLRAAIYQTEEELRRFRQLVVNCLMATDIFDPTLKALRDQRWNRAFHAPSDGIVAAEPEDRVINRKATIVIEHIIQASDVSHTMQHWRVYTLWNEKLFREMYKAYAAGRSAKDPTDGWYEGELWFFDNYVIPLARKLKECGVFGVSSDEYLDYAEANRSEWKKKGKALVIENQMKIKAELEGELRAFDS